VTVRAVKMGEEGSLSFTESFEVNDENAATRFQNPPDFVRALQSGFLRQVMKHDCA
jgi:hypothetical protein